MFKFCALILSSMVFSSIHCGVVKREDIQSNEVYSSPSVAVAGDSVQISGRQESSEELEEDADARVTRQLSGYISPTAFQPALSSSSSQTAYTVSPTVAAAPATATTAAGNPLGALTAIFSPSNTKSASDGVQGIIGGAVGAATSGVRTVLEVKRDLLLPVILGILNLGQNVANSEILRTIVEVKVNAAKTVLSIGPVIIEVLGGIASTAGDVTNGIFKTLICNIICPIHREPTTCRAQSSCSASSGASKTTSSSSSGTAQDYVLT